MNILERRCKGHPRIILSHGHYSATNRDERR